MLRNEHRVNFLDLTWEESLLIEDLSELEDSKKTVRLRSRGNHIFVSFFSSQSLQRNAYNYFEVAYQIPDSPRVFKDDQIKIGVTADPSNKVSRAFSDHEEGWAFYGYSGQLRNHSGSGGSQYSRKTTQQDVIGVFVDTKHGKISFSLNGEDLGPAFESEKLTQKPLFASVALLEKDSRCSFIFTKETLFKARKVFLFTRKFGLKVGINLLPTNLFRELVTNFF